MSWHFSKKLGNVRLNFSKSGIGYSIGTKGARLTKRANAKSNASAPSKSIDSNDPLPKSEAVSLWVFAIISVVLLTISVWTFDIILFLFTIFVFPIIAAIIMTIIIIIESIVDSKNEEKEEKEDKNRDE